MKDLKTCREEIDAIDKEIIALFEKRMHVSKDVITYKLAHDMQIFQKDREKEVIQKSTIAPPIRKSVTTRGVTAPPNMINLDMGDISPHMAFAPNMAACPFQRIFSILLLLCL